MEMLHRRVRGAREPTARPTPQSASLLADAAAEYASNNRMPALRLFDAALACASSREEAAAAAWGAASVHASFGDVEPAQISLRAALDAGLDLDKALAVRPGDSTGLLVPFRGAPQITSQLKKFASAVARAWAAPPPPPPKPAAVATGPGGRQSAVPADLDGIDGSVGAIAVRVAGLVAALLGLGVGLYLYGLRFLVPGGG